MVPDASDERPYFVEHKAQSRTAAETLAVIHQAVGHAVSEFRVLDDHVQAAAGAVAQLEQASEITRQQFVEVARLARSLETVGPEVQPR